MNRCFLFEKIRSVKLNYFEGDSCWLDLSFLNTGFR